MEALVDEKDAGKRGSSAHRRVCLSDDEIGQIHGVENALKSLLERTSHALAVSLALLLLPDKVRTIRIDGHDRPLQSAGRVVRDLEEHLAKRTKNSAAAEQLAFEPARCGPHLTAPIYSDVERFEGVLFLARSEGGKGFSGRERRVVDAVTGNIGEIIAARFDCLTGLINQREFDYVLESFIASTRARGLSHSMLHVNLDRLQSISDSFGTDAANAAIREVAATLRAALGDAAVIAHLGADEFGVLLRDCPADRGWAIGQDIRRAIRDMSIVHDQPLKLTVSIGVASLSATETVASAQAAARIACIVAKNRGRDRVALYQHQDAAVLHADAAFRVAKTIQQALRDDRFLLYCQPIAPLTPANESRSYEILLRGLDEDGEAIPPNDFLPQAEHNRLMPSIDRWVLKHSLEAIADIRRCPEHCYFAINLSGQSLCDSSFLDFIRSELLRTRVAPELVCFEVTETAAILNINRAIELMSNLRSIGCRFSLDDFGSGLSSFSYLKRLPLDHLKIDGQFVREIVEDPVSNAMVAAINQMSHALGLKTIAEFVENTAIKTQLAGIGVDFGQGSGIERPKPLDVQLEQLAKVRPIRRLRRA